LIRNNPEEIVIIIEKPTIEVEPTTWEEKKLAKDNQLAMDAAKDCKFPIFSDTSYGIVIDGYNNYNELIMLIKDMK
jgi:hypothetical protein